MRKFVVSAMALATVMFGSAAHAEVITVNYSGNFTLGTLTGQAFAGTITYDTAALNQSIFPGTGKYFNGVNITLNTGSISFVSDPDLDDADVLNDIFTGDSVRFNSGYNGTSYLVQVDFGDTSGTVLSGAELPSYATLARLTNTFVQLNDSSGQLGAGRLILGLQVTSAVPEPASWAMMIGGIGVMGGALRRQRKVTTKVSYA